ncbi:uncharacterized protein F5Z01DRAFT_633433 [Emericellopsis atlantica]|uniref:Uncharacterized protein n=1 Tax=Emericellopsis atlantica TaxID=2614577 RepID=A0A9P7ZTS6_9HYPO|nr:uncharacterized protein F5Z01DRAFT_633433 [Emericellopsis atlantica]KAG9257493.1 hypothetical protein F5Z01DRAFT_633433 [Emericellopsis atlantica]
MASGEARSLAPLELRMRRSRRFFPAWGTIRDRDGHWNAGAPPAGERGRYRGGELLSGWSPTSAAMMSATGKCSPIRPRFLALRACLTYILGSWPAQRAQSLKDEEPLATLTFNPEFTPSGVEQLVAIITSSADQFVSQHG